MVLTVNIFVLCSMFEETSFFMKEHESFFCVCVCAVNFKSWMLHQLVFKYDKIVMVLTVNIFVLCSMFEETSFFMKEHESFSCVCMRSEFEEPDAASIIF